MATILRDFADLSDLKVQLSKEEIVPSVIPHHEPIVRVQIEGNAFFDYKTYLDAAASAVKAYPILSVNYTKLHFTSSKKNHYLSYRGDGRVFVFRYNQNSDKRVFQSKDRLDAFRTIMFIYLEVRKIAASHIQIVENTAVGNFVLYINEVPIVASSYNRFSGSIPFLRSMKKDILQGKILPKTINEGDAAQMGEQFRKNVNASFIYDYIEIFPELDYSVFDHRESIRVSTKKGVIVTPKSNKVKFKTGQGVKHGRSSTESPGIFQPLHPWMDNWDDRFDHDD